MVKVLKKNGKKQVFSAAKLRGSIAKAAKDAKLTPTRTKQVVKDVAEPVIALVKRKKVIRAVDLRRLILGRLDKKAKAVSKAWRKFDRKK